MLNFLNYLLGFILILLIQGYSFFKTFPHSFLWFHNFFFFSDRILRFFWLIFVNLFLSIFSDKSLELRLVDWGLSLSFLTRKRLACILLDWYLINYLSNLLVTQFSWRINNIVTCAIRCLIFLSSFSLNFSLCCFSFFLRL